MGIVTSDWPLIKYLIVQDDYRALCENYLLQTIEVPFNPSSIISTYPYYHDLMTDFAEAEQEIILFCIQYQIIQMRWMSNMIMLIADMMLLWNILADNYIYIAED